MYTSYGDSMSTSVFAWAEVNTTVAFIMRTKPSKIKAQKMHALHDNGTCMGYCLYTCTGPAVL